MRDNNDAVKTYGKLKEAYADLNEMVRAAQYRTGIMDDDGRVSVDEALDLLEGSKELTAYREKYPNVDHTVIARLNSSDVDFENALNEISNYNNVNLNDNSSSDILSKLESDQSKILDLSDSEIEKVEFLLRGGE